MRIGFAAICSAVFLLSAAQRAAAQEYAPTSMTAAEIVAKMMAAVGSLQSGSYLISERGLNGDGTVTLTTIEIRGGDFLALEQTGARTSEYGRYQGQAWYRDPNGTVIAERDEAMDGSAAEVAWIRKQAAHATVRVLGVTQSPPEQYVLAFTSDGGSNVSAYVDAHTYLLSRIDHDGRSSIDYSDYRNVFGTTTAFEVRYSQVGFPQNGSDVHTLSWTESPTSDAAMTVPQSQPLFDVSSEMTLPARFAYEDGMYGDIVLNAHINGQSIDLALDSGSTDFVLDPGAAARLGLTVTGKQRTWVGGPLDESQTIVPEMSVGNLTMRNVAFTVLPIDFGEEGGHPVGLIGCDFFESAIVGVDLKAQTLTLYPRATFDPTALGLVATPIRTDSCVAEVAAMFEGVRGTFLIDTGAYGTILGHPFLGKLPRAQRQTDTSSMFSSVGYSGFLGGEAAEHTYAIDNFVFAGVLFRTGEVDILDNYGFGDFDGIIGRNVLSEFTVYFDYADGVAFFKLNT